MKSNLDMNFGLIIAFLLPGFILIYGLSFTYPDLKTALLYTAEDRASVAAFLLTTLASLASGLVVSALRWMILDSLFLLCGVTKTQLEFSKLSDANIYQAFIGIVENHYRYYQYYSNAFISILVAAFLYVIASNTKSLSHGIWIALIIILFSLFLGALDSLTKYHKRASKILGVIN